MIGDGWDGEPSVRPGEFAEEARPARRIAIVTGSRADFGLLLPVIRACAARDDLAPMVIAAGSHLISPGLTYQDVRREVEVAERVPMQVAGRTGRDADVEALGAGVARFGRAFVRLAPDWVVVLGDRIEALAAALAASVGGYALAHIHGGDRAEGVADESMRHAITKLAHLHLAATGQSAERIRRMGERAEMVVVAGSPAIDDLARFERLGDGAFVELGAPDAVLLMHPIGRHAEEEETAASAALEALAARRSIALHPNHDAGRDGILRAIRGAGVREAEHLPRPVFIGLLRRLAEDGGLLVGNSSAALIEASALRLPAVDIGARQAGREAPGNVVHARGESAGAIREAIDAASAIDRTALRHPYGDGRAGERIASALARVDARGLLRKRCVY
ncbi:MAG: UDP-N-acetylglucosamine 2-epimerase (hydrolyzing) [Phycisphaeraceae bacterium]|nr:UDP-N-acetylglucosamine 2-epimerase (hydrolyzing) [Phycisphaeraceae bacterium]